MDKVATEVFGILMFMHLDIPMFLHIFNPLQMREFLLQVGGSNKRPLQKLPSRLDYILSPPMEVGNIFFDERRQQ